MLGLFIGLALAFVVPVRGYLEQRSDLRAQQAALAGELQERERLRERLAELKSNPEVLETEARRIGLARPGEKVWSLPLPSRGGAGDRSAGTDGG